MGDQADLVNYYSGDEDDDRPVACKFCKRKGFYWEEMMDWGWRLVTEKGRIHECKAYRKAGE
jgi:hypothetical protein